MEYVERCGLQRNAADERFSTAPILNQSAIFVGVVVGFLNV
jgi:hypothetical protein